MRIFVRWFLGSLATTSIALAPTVSRAWYTREPATACAPESLADVAGYRDGWTLKSSLPESTFLQYGHFTCSPPNDASYPAGYLTSAWVDVSLVGPNPYAAINTCVTHYSGGGSGSLYQPAGSTSTTLGWDSLSLSPAYYWKSYPYDYPYIWVTLNAGSTLIGHGYGE